MAKFSPTTLILFTVLLLLYAISASSTKDPELKQCEHQCRVQQQFDRHEKEACVRKCEDYVREKKERERSEEQRGRRGEGYVPLEVNPPKRLSQCREQCERYAGGSGEERQLCRFRCQQRWGEHGGEDELGHHDRGSGSEEEGGDNPYVFDDRHFETRVKTEQGRVDVLQKFTEKSRLLRGIENYRIAILVANPNSFIVPYHWDADAIFFVTQGRGTISLIEEEKRESFNIEKGDVIRIRAGTPIYLINRHQNEKLFIVKLLNPVNLPGEYEAFFGAGGENPESFFTAFSWEILEAAFKTSRDKLERVFRKQGDGSIVKASREQIESLSDHGEGSSKIWPFGGESSRFKFNLFSRGPLHSNNYGQIFESDAAFFRPLKDLDVAVSYANITKGSMTALAYNSRATKIAIVVRGKGRWEMACPHVSSSGRGSGSEKQSGPSYQKISARLRPDSVVVVPAGHPFVAANSGNENLEILCFEVNVEGNVRYPMVGRTNVFKHMEREAKELAFKRSSREVDEIFGNQDSDFFLPGPRRQRDGVADD